MKNKKGISKGTLALIGLAVLGIILIFIFVKTQGAFMGKASKGMGSENIARQKCISSMESWQTSGSPDLAEGGYWHGKLCAVRTDVDLDEDQNKENDPGDRYTCCGNLTNSTRILNKEECPGICT